MRSSRRSALASRPVRGFTLLEILVVMTLLSVVMVALGSAMRLMAQTEGRIDQRLARADEFRVAVAFIRSTLGRVSAQKVEALPQPDALPYLFSAAPGAVEWVGIMPARYGAGGRNFFRLAVEGTGGDAALVIRFQPLAEAAVFPDMAQAESRVLVSQVKGFAIRYEDARKDPPVWSPGWTHRDYLPQRLALTVQTASGPWPELVVPLRALPASNGGSDGGFVIGGSR